MRKALGPKTATPSNLEAVIQNAILAECGSLPGVLLLVNSVFRMPNPHGHGWIQGGLGEGSPDLVGAVDGRFCALEVKRPGESPEPHQAALHAAWRRLNIFVAVVHSVGEANAAIDRCRDGRVTE